MTEIKICESHSRRKKIKDLNYFDCFRYNSSASVIYLKISERYALAFVPDYALREPLTNVNPEDEVIPYHGTITIEAQ